MDEENLQSKVESIFNKLRENIGNTRFRYIDTIIFGLGVLTGVVDSLSNYNQIDILDYCGNAFKFGLIIGFFTYINSENLKKSAYAALLAGTGNLAGQFITELLRYGI